MVDPWPLGPGTGGDLLERPRRQPGGQGVGAQLAHPAVNGGEHPPVYRDREHVGHLPLLEHAPEPELLAVHLITGHPARRHAAVRRVSSAVRLPLPDGVGQVRHPRGGLRADRLQGHAARVHALEQADSGAEQHG